MATIRQRYTRTDGRTDRRRDNVRWQYRALHYRKRVAYNVRTDVETCESDLSVCAQKKELPPLILGALCTSPSHVIDDVDVFRRHVDGTEDGSSPTDVSA